MTALAPLPVVVASCVTSAQRTPYSLNCNAGAQYTIDVRESYEFSDPLTYYAPWYAAGDFTPGATISATVANPANLSSQVIMATPIEGSGRCGSHYALLLEAHGHHDWGSTFGDYRIGGNYAQGVYFPIDVSQYEGVAFWARDPGYTSRYDGPTTKSIALNLIDAEGSLGSTTGYGNDYDGSPCTQYNFDAAAVTSIPMNVATGATPTGSQAVAGLVLPADACNNAFYTVPITLTDEWQLYTIPFSAFTMPALPNREPKGLDVAHLMSLTISVPKEEQLELWIDDFGFYRTKVNDGGTAEGAP
jgi:hypothetical protein